MNQFVYLAGPITGCTEGEAKDWRQYVAGKFICGIIGISPLRCEPIVGERYTPQHADLKFGTSRAIMNKNLLDVRKCDMILAYLPTVSQGTLIELGWGHAFRKPIVLVSDNPIVTEHAVVNAVSGWVLPSLDDGIDVVTGILHAYVGGKNV